MNVKAFLAITMKVPAQNRATAANVYTKYRQPFLDTIPGALSKQLLIRNKDVQVLHGFDSIDHAKAYLKSELFTKHVFTELQPTWSEDPDVRIYQVQ